LPSEDLTDSPHGGVQASDEADLRSGRAVRSQKQRHHAPGERVVQVVDEAGLGASTQRRLAVGGLGECVTQGRRALVLVVPALALFQSDVPGGVSDEARRK